MILALVIGQLILIILRPPKTLDCDIEDDTCYWLYIMIMILTVVIVYIYAVSCALV